MRTNRAMGSWSRIDLVYKQFIVSLVECKIGYALIDKEGKKTSDLVSQAIFTKLNSWIPLVNALTFDNGKEFAEYARIDNMFRWSICWLATRITRKIQWPIALIHPKKRPLSTVTNKELEMIQEEIFTTLASYWDLKPTIKCLCSP